MKKIYIKLEGKGIPVILIAALICTGALAVGSINRIQGNARVINYTGIVRGATQRLIKKELNNVPDDQLIDRLDGILKGLSEGSEEFGLIKLNDREFQELLADMDEAWKDIKKEIINYRNGSNGDTLFEISETYFELADQTVMTAELYAEKSVHNTERSLLFINIIFFMLAGLSGLSAYRQGKQQQKLKLAEEKNRVRSEKLNKRFQELLIPMNEISELLYVSDIETYDVLFINEAGKKTFHIDEKKGLKCYQALQGLDAPCPFCTTSYLKEGETFIWEHTNSLTKRHYMLRDRLMEWEGRPARMEIAFDITKTADEKLELKKRLESDNILIECIRELYCNHNTANAALYALEQVGRLFLVDRAYILSFKENCLSNIAQWCREGVQPMDHMYNIPQPEYSQWLGLFEKQENLIIHDVESLRGKMDAAYGIFVKQGIQSMVMVPLETNGKPDGCICLDNPSSNLLDSAVSLLQTLRYFLMLAIRRNENEKALYKLSYRDTLTSFYNRNRYIKDISDLAGKDCPIGIIYVDVNGLKEVNDQFGHDIGDKLLKDCAGTIEESLHQGCSFYRIGGDEFVIICADWDRGTFYESVDCLKQHFKDSTCKAAIGAQWEENCKNINMVITMADQHMYTDKKAYYHDHPSSPRYRYYNDSSKEDRQENK